MISDIHIWFGVARSKNRGLAGFFLRFFLAGWVNPCSCSVRWTVDVEALTRKNRLRMSEMRRGPRAGSGFLRSMIDWVTAIGVFDLDFPRAWFINPCCPYSRYRLAQRYTLYSLIALLKVNVYVFFDTNLTRLRATLSKCAKNIIRYQRRGPDKSRSPAERAPAESHRTRDRTAHWA